jgi:hypothetical protein
MTTTEPLTQRRRPPASAFEHAEDCRTPDAEPEWYELEAEYWTRVCSCQSEYARTSTSGPDPSSEAARPSWRAHQHDHGCENPELAVVVRVEQLSSGDGGGWRSTCLSCATSCLYWLDPERQEWRDGQLVRVTFYGPVRYVYELAASDDA